MRLVIWNFAIILLTFTTVTAVAEITAPIVVPRPKPAILEKPAPQQPTPPPDAALPDEPGIASALAEDCRNQLSRLGTKFSIPETVASTVSCHIDNPVVLASLDNATASFSFTDKPLLNCNFALAFSKWAADIAAPVVSSHELLKLSAIATGPGYVCRGRNGDAIAKISEHALGNAVDIDSIVLDGKTRLPISAVADTASPHYGMLMALRLSACGYFTTVLGPGANEAHKEHYHFDLGVHGKSDNYRICE